METVARAQIEAVFANFAAKDMEAVLALFADDAVVIDPHYPNPRMEGKTAMRAGFEWGFTSLEKPGFTILRFWSEGESGVVEVDTHHRLRGGMEIRFPQVFVFESRDGLLTRLQSYTPYGPHGIAGLMLRVTRLMGRVKRKT